MTDPRIIAALAGPGGATQEELEKIDPNFLVQLKDLPPVGLCATVILENGDLRFHIEGATPEDQANYAAHAELAKEAARGAAALGPAAPPPSHSPADAPPLTEPAPMEKEVEEAAPGIPFSATVYVTDFRVSSGGGRVKITAIVDDDASAGAALLFSGRAQGPIVMEVSEKKFAGRGTPPKSGAAQKPERSAAEIAGEIADQEKGGQLPGGLAAAMGNLIRGAGGP